MSYSRAILEAREIITDSIFFCISFDACTLSSIPEVGWPLTTSYGPGIFEKEETRNSKLILLLLRVSFDGIAQSICILLWRTNGFPQIAL
jgi:hypothetical protein